jgi:hypothetical protein
MQQCCFDSPIYHGCAANNDDHCRDDDHFMSSFGWLGLIGDCSR